MVGTTFNRSWSPRIVHACVTSSVVRTPCNNCHCVHNFCCNLILRAMTRSLHALALCALDASIRAYNPAAPAKSTVTTACLPVVSIHRTVRRTSPEQRWKRLKFCPGGIGRRPQPTKPSSAIMRVHAWGGRPGVQASALTATWAIVSTDRGVSLGKGEWVQEDMSVKKMKCRLRSSVGKTLLMQLRANLGRVERCACEAN